ncbi:NAD-dependent epimerase/dehydratase family protein [Maribius pontilimi]|uniref:NAD-dependent epimerase/dehydratase family protein n=1 Tax=Palleronia pontilimi TaxID=1964209 RepID=A0A934IIM3_9RHOB|nr:D-erythronate dehydrogenase [Palleronia pontilimi]MBJ3764050.1 NAD-dependent epimerase/dehydratase family protein [Palleronia pontilimi]
MNVLIIGGGGVVGNRLGASLAERGTLRGAEIDRITLADVSDPPRIDAKSVTVDYTHCDITDQASIAACLTEDTDVVYLLAAIVSAHAEEDFATGYAINLFGTWNVLERCRTLGTQPVVVFTSSIAVYGGEVDDPITGQTFLNPQTSYGAQKAAGEVLLNDFSRKGYVDGRGVRLPTVSVRPGKPNRAASSFMSSIIREPLGGQQAVCPVGADFLHYYLSLRKCVQNLVKVAEIDRADLGRNHVMQMPGRTWSIRQMIDAMTAVAGPEPAKLIRWEDDPQIQSIVNGWRFDIHADKALALGLEADESFEDNVRYYLEDDRPTG